MFEKNKATSEANSKNLELGELSDMYGIKATDKRIKQKKILRIPPPDLKGKIATLNKKGFMSPNFNEYNLAFIEYASKSTKPILDIGAAYGLTVLEALKKRGAPVIANDIDEGHLLLLREKAPQEYWPNLYLNFNAFPNEINFPENSLGAVLASRIFHFLSPDEIERGLDKICSWLEPNGHLYIITMSPYRPFLSEFIMEYEQRWKDGNSWPGVITNMSKFASHLKENVPEYMHAMDHRPLQKALLQRGFSIEKYSFFDQDDSMSANQARNNCGVFAKKLA